MLLFFPRFANDVLVTGFEKLSELKNLKIFNLGNNCFNNTIMKSVGNLTSLRTLILRVNNMEGSSFPSKGNFF